MPRSAPRYDALVVGSGPAGSVAALVLARGGARVALLDKAGFPRDKACGDLVGPRGVQVLDELGVPSGGPRLGDMEVIGPTGRRVRLPARPGRTYPGYAVVARRTELDAGLRAAALDAGAEAITGRAAAALFSREGQLEGFEVEGDNGPAGRLTAEVVIGADGALSRVGAAARLVNNQRVIWGFAVRGYLAGHPELPEIHLWEPSRRSGYPGYGWVFPGLDGQANAGLGVAARGDRRPGARAVQDLARFLASAGRDRSRLGPTLGGWLKLGMVGTNPAAGRVLLTGDAAGLVNPLQGEGIAQALASGRAAAEAVLKSGPDRAAGPYRSELARLYGPHAATTAPVTGWMIERPRVVAGVERLLTWPVIGRLLAGGWAIYWNDLLEGAQPGHSQRVAWLAARAGRLITARAPDRLEIADSLGASPAPPGL